MVKKPGTKILHAELSPELHKRLTELKGAGRSWAAWLDTIQNDFRRAREEVELHRDQAEFWKKQFEIREKGGEATVRPS